MTAFVLRLLGALWNVAGILLLVLLVTEFGITGFRRLSRRLRYGKEEKPDPRALADGNGGATWAADYYRALDRLVRFDWKPFELWRQRPLSSRYINIDAAGRRVTPGAEAAGKDAPRIAFFGGSTAFGIGARDEGTIPAVLQRRLIETGHRVAVMNCGQCAHVSTQELIGLIQMLKHEPPIALAVFYDGVNELSVAEWSGRADGVMAAELRAAEFGLFAVERQGDLIRAALAAAIPRTLRRLRSLTGLPLQGPVPRLHRVSLSEAELAPLAAAVTETYAANVRIVRLLARAHGFRPLFFRQPVLTAKKTQSPYEQQAELNWTRDAAMRRRLALALDEAFRRHPELSAAPDVIDLSSLFDNDPRPLYVDFCHLGETGNAAVAEAMLPALQAALTREG